MTIALDDEVTAALDGFATLPDWLAAGMRVEQVSTSLTQHVPELADGRLQLVSVWPQRLRAKGADWLARYAVTVVEPGGATRDVVVTGLLYPPETEAPAGESPAVPAQAQAPAVPAQAQAPAVPAQAQAPAQEGPAFGEPGWHCWLPDLRLALQVEVADEALPALPSLVEPAAAGRLLEQVLRSGPYPDAVVTDCTPRVVRYKPGSRCTVVTEVRYADLGVGPVLPNPVVVKTHQGDKGSTAWEAMRALWDTELARGDTVALAEPLGFLPEERVLVQGPVPGNRTLKELAREAITDGGEEPLAELRAGLAKTAGALAALHTCGARYGRVATFDEELDEVESVVARLALSVPELQPAAEPLLARMRHLSDDLPVDPVVCAHHDFRPAQVMLHDGGVGFIDFDGSCMAEPALDLGRFRAKLRDIGISALAASGQPLEGEPLAANFALLDDLCDGFLAAYQEQAPVSSDRVLLWETCDLFTAMLHAWTKVRLARIGPRLAVLQHHLRTVAFG